MASRPFAFSANNTRLEGTENTGRILIGEPAIGFQAALDNEIRFFMGPEEVPGKIIACFITTEETPFGTNTSPAIGDPTGGPTAYFAFEELDSATDFVSWVEKHSITVNNPVVFDKTPGNNGGENDAVWHGVKQMKFGLILMRILCQLQRQFHRLQRQFHRLQRQYLRQSQRQFHRLQRQFHRLQRQNLHHLYITYMQRMQQYVELTLKIITNQQLLYQSSR